MTVHDELVLEVHETETERMPNIVREEMEGAMALDVALRVDVAMGRTWAQIH